MVANYESELQKLQEQNANLEIRHTKEMSVFQSQLSNYKRTVESLKLDLVASNESHNKEKELLNEQIKLHKLQLDEITTKYIATASVLDSKESIERSLEQALTDAASLRTDNEDLKVKIILKFNFQLLFRLFIFLFKQLQFFFSSNWMIYH